MQIGIFLDLDGTLINSQKEISFLNQIVIKTLKKSHKIYLVTGQSLRHCIRHYQKLELQTKIITSAGQVISSPFKYNDLPETHFTPFKQVIKIFATIKKEFVINNFLIETFDNKYYVKTEGNSNLLYLIASNRNLIIYKKQTISQIVGVYVEIEKIDKQTLLQKTWELNQKYLNQLNVQFWFTEGNLPVLQIKPFDINKGNAMLQIAKTDNLNQTMAFGNGWIDRELLQKANISYAMLNSNNKIKSFAKHITQYDNNNSGVGRELQKIFKLKNLSDNLK